MLWYSVYDIEVTSKSSKKYPEAIRDGEEGNDSREMFYLSILTNSDNLSP
jgi:hypothetical protein